MSKLSETLKKNIPLIVVATITAALFIYPYLGIGDKSTQTTNANKSPVPVVVASVSKTTLNQQYKAVATVHGKSEIPVLSQVSGVLQKVNVKIGDRVTKGQSLAILDSRLQLADLRQAQAQLVRSTDELKRAQALVDRRLANQTRLQTAIAQKSADQENVKRLMTLLSFTNFPSPITGIITDQQVFTGNTVQAGSPLFTVSDISGLLVVAKVPETIASTLKVGDGVLLQSEFTNDPLPAKIGHVSPASDIVSHQIGVELNAGSVFPKLKPGYQVSVLFSTAIREQAITLDRTAITEDTQSGEVTVFVVKNNKVEKRKIELGAVLENQVEVIQGLSEGELVVTKGMEQLKDGAPVKIITGPSTDKK